MMRQILITKSITNRSSATIDKYLNDIGKEEMISVEMEGELTTRIRKGDQQALDKLVRANLRFVVSVAKKYEHNGLSLPDLINEGNIGLIKAAQRFDETRGFKFISYAVWWIRQTIIQALSEQVRIVRLPLNRIGELRHLKQSVIELEQQLEREPTTGELAEFMDIDESQLILVAGLLPHSRSIDAPMSDHSDLTIGDTLTQGIQEGTDSYMMHESLNMELERALGALSNRERLVIKSFFGIGLNQPCTLEEIGNELNLTRERIRQIKEKALRKLQGNKQRALLQSYL